MEASEGRGRGRRLLLVCWFAGGGDCDDDDDGDGPPARLPSKSAPPQRTSHCKISVKTAGSRRASCVLCSVFLSFGRRKERPECELERESILLLGGGKVADAMQLEGGRLDYQYICSSRFPHASHRAAWQPRYVPRWALVEGEVRLLTPGPRQALVAQALSKLARAPISAPRLDWTRPPPRSCQLSGREAMRSHY